MTLCKLSTMGELANWRADMKANESSAKGRLIMSLFRLGRALPPTPRKLYKVAYYALTDVMMGVTLPLTTQVGPGLTIRHGQGLVVSGLSKIGANCTLYQNVTLGQKHDAAPVIGDDVTVGASAVLLGGIQVGPRSFVGAGAVVLENVPADSMAVGQAAAIRPVSRYRVAAAS